MQVSRRGFLKLASAPAATPAPTPTARPTATPAPTPTAKPPETPAAGAEVKKYIHQVLATGEVGANRYASQPPGQSTVLERGYPGAPPLVPHSLSGLTITKDENPCLTCHTQGVSFGPGHTATEVPDSHYIDLTTGARSQSIQAMRYNCLICHVPQSPEAPPVESSAASPPAGG